MGVCVCGGGAGACTWAHARLFRACPSPPLRAPSSCYCQLPAAPFNPLTINLNLPAHPPADESSTRYAFTSTALNSSYVYVRPAAASSWGAAAPACASLGGRLWSANSDAENAAVLAAMGSSSVQVVV